MINCQTHGGLDRITNSQKERAYELYHPLQQSLKTRNDQPSHSQPSTIKHHRSPTRANSRNKFSRMSEVRHRHKQDQLSLRREKVTDDQLKQSLQVMHELDSISLQVDLDQLIDEERELESLREQEKEKAQVLTELEEYERELEAYFQDLEIRD
ncbi:hypothetical protein PSN45_001473 [Yamadazyma tenuis]|uniref:Uncharacterized protein n=1 Tax=Candida tenuis (strain ATCC 10573 / BCRC 21748 / CBS 615 / JCM 9827 / NBRC 10315 / NRRL Y-1498 / VKM Y-70) TaxID=590646 RepID=G3BFU9_CANTC|nr:uncharacterized protein CANTEDRAFT_116807 [Yamadazyma tenuis ATCC 10573]EGV60735.1 hypothetical protein CANTEDRAFT_116807 [Yamadazyma tenuis ATCC 10573]WEJ93996.1 hypothetical protein PSN45_001473 [Yamadazyma tenuis]